MNYLSLWLARRISLDGNALWLIGILIAVRLAITAFAPTSTVTTS